MVRGAILVIAAFLGTTCVSYAGEPAAIVEDASGTASGLRQMELLEVGRVITLSGNETLILGYLRSCVRETITGGHITIGEDESTVIDGSRQTEEVDCDGGTVARSNSNAVAGAVFRKGRKGQKLPKPNWTVFGARPMIRVPNNSSFIKFERLDKEEPSIKVAAKSGWADCASAGITLTPSGLYVLTYGKKFSILKVSPLAEKDTALLSRLVLL